MKLRLIQTMSIEQTQTFQKQVLRAIRATRTITAAIRVLGITRTQFLGLFDGRLFGVSLTPEQTEWARQCRARGLEAG